MQLPFTVEQFYDVFRAYNDAVWPMQLLLLALAVAALAFLAVPRAWSCRAISAILALFWAWMAFAYHFAFFTQINKLAYAFGGVSIAGAALFLWQGTIRNRLQFRARGGVYPWAGGVLIVFALVLYPLWSWLVGHQYPAMPTFGLPCPTTIFTIGMLAFLTAPYPRSPLVVPLMWCLVGGSAAFLLGVPQDLGLFAAAALTAILLARPQRSAATPASA